MILSWKDSPTNIFKVNLQLSLLDGFFLSHSSSVYSDRKGLIECSIFLLAFCTSLESQTTINLVVYATSAFSKHSLVATVLVVQGVVNGKLSGRQTQSKHVFTTH